MKQLMNFIHGLFRMLVGLGQRVHTAPLIEVVTLITKTLVGARNRVHALVTHGAGGIIHSGVVGICKRRRVGTSGSRLFDIHPQELEIRPASARSITIGICRRKTSQPGWRT